MVAPTGIQKCERELYLPRWSGRASWRRRRGLQEGKEGISPHREGQDVGTGCEVCEDQEWGLQSPHRKRPLVGLSSWAIGLSH